MENLDNLVRNYILLRLEEDDLRLANHLIKRIPSYFNNLQSFHQVIIDFDQTGFVSPHGLMILLMLIKKIYLQTEKRVTLKNISCNQEKKIYQYIERSDFFKVAKNWIEFDDPCKYEDIELFERTPGSSTIMPITSIKKSTDYNEVAKIQEEIISHAKIILKMEGKDLTRFIHIFGELVDNIKEWSQGDGYIFIQKYSSSIYLSIADDGIGICKSLLEQKNNPDNTKNIEDIQNEKDLFEFAFSENGPRSASGGLHGIINTLKKTGDKSYLSALSGNYYNFINKENAFYANGLPIHFQGTIANVRIK